MFRSFSSILLTALAVSLPAIAALAQTAAPSDAKAQEILKQAREALGGEAKLKSLQGLSATGNVRRSFGQNTVEGELEVEMIVPDKIRISTGMQTPGGDVTSIQVLNGGQLWSDVIRPVGMGGGGGMFVMRGPGGGGGGGNAQDQAANEARQKAEFARLTLGWLLMAPSSFPVQYSYAGEAVAPDGKADVIDVKGAGDFSVRLFFDQKSHQLLMLSYKGKDFRQMMQFRQGGPGGQGRPPGMISREELEKLPPEERKKKEEEMRAAREKMQAEMRERMAKLPDVDFNWNFTDYKSVNGINLPHRLTKSTGGDPTEEWEISKFKVNPQIKPDKFEKKEKSQGSN